MTNCEVKMAGWAKFFLAFLWTETKSRSIKTQKKNEANNYTDMLTEQAWSIKDLLYGQKDNFL